MKKSYDKKNGYLETIQKGLKALGMLGRNVSSGKGSREEQIELLKNEIQKADAVVIGAGAGLSTSAGFTYSGERFEKYFFSELLSLILLSIPSKSSQTSLSIRSPLILARSWLLDILYLGS